MTNNHRSETNISPTTVNFSGWLHKRSRWLRQWRRRYIKISGNLMYFSAQEESKDSHQLIDLSEYELVRSADESTKKEFTFEIVGSFVTRYTFQASSITEMQEWMETIAKVIDRYQPSSKVIKNVVGKTFIVLSDGKLYKIENYEHHHQYEISRLMLSQQSNSTVSMAMSMSQSFNIPTPKYTPVDIPILTKQQRKCLLLPMYRNKPFEIKDSSKKKPLILVRGDNNEVIFLPAW